MPERRCPCGTTWTGGEGLPGVCPECGAGGRVWIYGPEAAARFIAAASWPNEREENRDSWAPKMLADRDMLAREIERARANLEAAIRAALVDPAREAGGR